MEIDWTEVLITMEVFIFGYQTGWYAGRRL
jgi:hypothetical protein